MLFLIAPIVSGSHFVRQSFARIRQAKPKQLFIIADGPRDNHPKDIDLCAECRKIVENVDWECEVYHNYADQNMGCGKRPATGFDWVFENVLSANVRDEGMLEA